MRNSGELTKKEPRKMPTNPVGTLWEANTIVLTASRLMTRTISLPQTERYGTEIPMS